ETRGGMMNEARLVLPIPPGTHWKDAKPILLPGAPTDAPALPAPPAPRTPRKKPQEKPPVVHGPPPGKVGIVVGGKIRYIDRPGYVAPPSAAPTPAPAEKPKRPPRPRAKNDPQHVAAARELRDRWMEEVNSGR